MTPKQQAIKNLVTAHDVYNHTWVSPHSPDQLVQAVKNLSDAADQWASLQAPKRKATR